MCLNTLSGVEEVEVRSEYFVRRRGGGSTDSCRRGVPLLPGVLFQLFLNSFLGAMKAVHQILLQALRVLLEVLGGNRFLTLGSFSLRRTVGSDKGTKERGKLTMRIVGRGVIPTTGATSIIAGTTHHNLAKRRRSELDTTLTELNAIAAAANIGFSKPNAATGIPMTL